MEKQAQGDSSHQEKQELTTCKECADTGFKMINGWANRCPCQLEIQNKKRLEVSGLMNTLDKYTFENYEIKEKHQNAIKESATRYVEEVRNNEKPWFFIGGQSGVGKSHICTAICSELMKMQKGLRYVIANKIILELKSCVMDTERYFRIMGNLVSVEVLYIDDLFKSRNVSDADIKVLFEIVNDRYNSNKITIISSEKTVYDLESVVDLEAVAGRIFEKASDYIINITKDPSKNYRKNKFLDL